DAQTMRLASKPSIQSPKMNRRGETRTRNNRSDPRSPLGASFSDAHPFQNVRSPEPVTVTLSVPPPSDTTGEPPTPAGPTRTDRLTPGARLMGGFATSWSTSRLYWVAAIGVMVLTIFLRLWRLDLVQFK